MHALVVAGLLVARTAVADPRPLPFGHSTETVLAGELRVTQIADLVPLPREVGSATSTFLVPAFQLELEAGLLDRLEVAFALTLVPDGPFEDAGNGLRQRAKYVLIFPGDWWLDVAVLLETTQHELTLQVESRAIARAVFDRLRIVANAGGEYVVPWFGQGRRELVALATLAATYEVVPSFVAGAEAVVRDRQRTNSNAPAGTDPLAVRPQLYAGPVVQARLGKLGVTAGAYVRVTDRDRPAGLGETYGRYWFRALVSFDL